MRVVCAPTKSESVSRGAVRVQPLCLTLDDRFAPVAYAFASYFEGMHLEPFFVERPCVCSWLQDLALEELSSNQPLVLLPFGSSLVSCAHRASLFQRLKNAGYRSEHLRPVFCTVPGEALLESLSSSLCVRWCTLMHWSRRPLALTGPQGQCLLWLGEEPAARMPRRSTLTSEEDRLLGLFTATLEHMPHRAISVQDRRIVVQFLPLYLHTLLAAWKGVTHANLLVGLDRGR